MHISIIHRLVPATRLRRLAVFVICFVFAAGCSPPESPEQATRYNLRGKVVSVDPKNRQVVLDHETIPGFMEAMVMPFTLKSEWAFKELAPGDIVQATLVVATSGAWLEDPVITKGMGGNTGTVPTTEPQPGAEVPNFSLVNQDNKPFMLRKYQEQALLVTFLYTRCPLPDYCILMNSNFAEVNRLLRQEHQSLRPRVRLLSVSIDPEHDTPEVLRSFGAAQTAAIENEGFESWEFVTGAPEEIKRMAQFFGLSYMSDNDQIVHSLRTAVITPGGRIFTVYRGNEWRAADAVRDLQSALRGEIKNQ
ncbi:MAG TPA: SCO family protein [Pyrinomonadaceae bacterium]|nr:SCO family protein [Pyrinomonadaceae bacterium]